MVGQSKTEGVGVRFGADIEELREFFRSRDVQFGSPGDLVAFAARVSHSGPFQDEMGSMVRSILFAENDSLGRGELLELLTTAVGGPAIGTGAQEVDASVRQIFAFVNEALRQHGRMFSTELQAGEEQVTAGDVLAAATAQEKTGGRTVGGRSPENGHYGRGTDAPDAARAAANEESGRGGEPVGGGGMLFRAVSMSEAEEADASLRRWEGSRRRWMIPAILAGVVALATGAYLARPLFEHAGAHGVGLSGLTQTGPAAAAGACAGPMAPSSSRSALNERSRWVHRLLDQQLYGAALPELKSIAQLDPGFPGVYLDESDALLHLKRPDDAREAVDTQIGISECMAKLPSPALDAYCSVEFTPEAAATCRPELARIREAAQIQAAMVHLELGHRIEPDGGAAAAAELAREDSLTHTRVSAGTAASPRGRARRVTPLPPASEGDNGRPAQHTVAAAKSPAAAKPARKVQGDESLMKGEGTDLSLGAYSKPQ